MNSWKEQIIAWKEELLRSSGNDVLIHLPESGKGFLELEGNSVEQNEIRIPITPVWKKIAAEAERYRQNSGVNSLSLVTHILEWNDGKKNFRSPFRLQEVLYSTDKIKNEIRLSIQEETFINPFLSGKLKELFGIEIQDSESLPEVTDWNLQPCFLLGNFHYHRFSLLKDMDDYLLDQHSEDSLIGTFFNGERRNEPTNSLPEKACVFPLDTYQQEAITKIQDGENLVIIGPPGSGKSQLIVNTLFQHALSGKRTVLASEKLAALEVIKTRFESIGLDRFCASVFHTEKEKSDFIQSLKETWLFVENTPVKQPQIASYPAKKEILQNKLSRLQGLPVIGSIPNNLPPLFHSVPKKDTWEKLHPTLDYLATQYALQYGTSFSNCSCFFLKPSVFFRDDSLGSLKTDLAIIRKTITFLSQEIEEVSENYPLSEWAVLYRKTIHAQVLSHELFSRNKALFEHESTDQKRFRKLSGKYLKVTRELENTAPYEQQKWKKNWSDTELEEALRVFTEKKNWSLSYRRWKARFIADYAPVVFSKKLALQALSLKKDILQKQKEQSKIAAQLIKYGVHYPETEIPLFESLIRQYNELDTHLVKTLRSSSEKLLQQLVRHSREITQIHRFITLNIHVSASLSLNEIIRRIEEEVDFLSAHRKSIENLLKTDEVFFYELPGVHDFSVLHELVTLGQVENFAKFHPELYHYSGEEFQEDLKQLIREEDTFCQLSAQEFTYRISQKFSDYHLLLSTPAAQLSQEQKQLKTELRKGRSILVKEFNKIRQHTGIRELLDSPARHWIHLLKPILLINPLSLSKIVPNRKGIFDFLVMDEASQIPTEHAIPALYRSAKVCLVGDPMQMPPSVYFTSGTREREDILNRGLFHFNAHMLLGHYRSLHENLISFSNHYFYGGKLKILPGSQLPSYSGIHGHFVKDALFENRSNVQEAKELVAWLNELLPDFAPNDQLGIVAFSEAQLDLIRHEITQHASPVLNQKVDEGSIFLSTLENIQGDECDILVVSIGYGYGADGKFALRFGPLNQSGGEKRLNVLFTRARKGIHIFHSIHHTDFPPSDNRGVELLKVYLRMLETEAINFGLASRTLFGLESSIDNEKREITFFDPYLSEQALQKMMTLFRVVSGRNWKINIVFRKDGLLLQNPG